MTGRPATKSAPCPVCGRDHYCRVWEEDGIVLCTAIEQGCMTHKDGSKVVAKNNMGFFHRITKTNGHANGNGKHHRPHPPEKKLTVTECRSILSECSKAMTSERIKSVLTSLGVSSEAVQAYQTGYSERRNCFVWPMMNGKLQPCGIRTRSLDGKEKRSILGSTSGIFVPANYSTAIDSVGFMDCIPQLLLLPEGPTDCMALYDLGYRAIGRPSNMGGSEAIQELLQSDSIKQDVVIVSDNDKPKWTPDGIPFVPGWEGALHLADAIIAHCNTLRIVRPPGDDKDIRKWANGGGKSDVLDRLIAEAEQLTRLSLTGKMDDIIGYKLRGHADRLLNHPDLCERYREDQRALARARNEAVAAYKKWKERK